MKREAATDPLVRRCLQLVTSGTVSVDPPAVEDAKVVPAVGSPTGSLEEARRSEAVLRRLHDRLPARASSQCRPNWPRT